MHNVKSIWYNISIHIFNGQGLMESNGDIKNALDWMVYKMKAIENSSLKPWKPALFMNAS